MRRAVFLDRDGILNRLVAHNGRAVAPRALAEFALLPGVPAAVAALRRAGLLAVVVTNQPEVARGRLDPTELARMHNRLQQAVPVDAIYVCPHDDADGCACRKPKPGLLERAARAWHVTLAESFLVGDSWRDVAAGKAAGCTTILLAPDPGAACQVEPDFFARDLPAAAELILGQLLRRNPPALARPGRQWSAKLRRTALRDREARVWP
jgi:D-glycero-D-manno-heptose 1,7-bisphosphate phosphatase